MKFPLRKNCLKSHPGDFLESIKNFHLLCFPSCCLYAAHLCLETKVPLAELLQICSIVCVRDTAHCTSPPPISIRNRHAFSLRFYKASAVHPIGSQADQMEGQAQEGRAHKLWIPTLSCHICMLPPFFFCLQKSKSKRPLFVFSLMSFREKHV